jgi:ADP-dependent NAD(P)H-hydrate dehydratase
MTTELPFRVPGLPVRHPESHKGDHGSILLIGGSRGMSGAIALAAMAGLRMGAGLVSAFVPDCCLRTVAGFDACVMTIPGPANRNGEFAYAAKRKLSPRLAAFDAIGVGPGMGTGPGSLGLVRMVAGLQHIPRVFDADALTVLSATDRLIVRGPAILTPHPGEFQRLTGVASNDRPSQIMAANDLAARCGVVVVLKGARTLVTDGTNSRFNASGNAGMATGGSGDCLTGIIVALLGQGLSVFDAAVLGVYLHGLAGDFAEKALGQLGMTAADLIHFLPPALLYHANNTP